MLGPDGEPLADWEIELAEQGVSTETSQTSDAKQEPKRDGGERSRTGRDENGRRSTRDGQRGNDRQRAGQGGGQGGDDSKTDGPRGDGEGRSRSRNDGGNRNQDGGNRNQGGGNRNDGGNRNQGGNQGGGNNDQDGGGNSKRRRRRRKGGGRGQEGPQGEDLELLDADGQPQSNEPVEVSGYLDMRDEGYGFLRLNGYLPSKDDAYIGVKLARQYGLRKGDQITGKMRPAQRNEKNPALLEVFTVNGGDPEAAKKRPRFENLTALFPDEKLRSRIRPIPRT